LTKSGFEKSTPKLLLNFIFAFQSIYPYFESLKITTAKLHPSLLAVSSSWTFIIKPPSPTAATTFFSGRTRFAAIAPGKAKPMEAKPLELITVLGSYAGKSLPIQILCAPTSLMRMSSLERHFRISYNIFWGFFNA